MASVIRDVFKAIREKGIGNFVKHLREEGYTKCLLDENLLQTKIHSIGATLVGVDKFGNKYYEKLQDTQHAFDAQTSKTWSGAQRELFRREEDEYIYHSKGHALNPGQRDWTRYRPWQPIKI